VVGRTDSRVAANSTEVVIETNVDDLDPRLWPAVLEEVLHAGASDAWLTPISMKKGRPAHTLSVLTTPGRRDAVLRTLFVHTSTIGVRSTTVEKTALVRRQAEVVVFGEKVGVKLAYLDGELVNASAEFDDVLALARRIDTAPATVMEAARAAAWALAEADDHWRD
jgi:pyridinium-3,5-bisthiocarboxylic acid mononucleotide nickel chelatase